MFLLGLTLEYNSLSLEFLDEYGPPEELGYPEFNLDVQSRLTFKDLRAWNMRRVIKLGVEGDNLPSIDFANDMEGEAHSVIATDIHGNLWILEIWGDKKTLMPSRNYRPRAEARQFELRYVSRTSYSFVN